MKALVTALTLPCVLAQYQEGETPENDPYLSDETAEGYAPLHTKYRYAKPITQPSECFGDDFEVWEQLQSPEWQLCQVSENIDYPDPENPSETKSTSVTRLHVCSTENPTEILLRWGVNEVQEDSF